MDYSRQSLTVEYRVSSTFIIPEGIDIHNKNQVKAWYVKYDILHIIFEDKNRPKMTIRPFIDAKDDDLKHADHVEFEYTEIDEDYKDEDYIE